MSGVDASGADVEDMRQPLPPSGDGGGQEGRQGVLMDGQRLCRRGGKGGTVLSKVNQAHSQRFNLRRVPNSVIKSSSHAMKNAIMAHQGNSNKELVWIQQGGSLFVFLIGWP